MIREGSGKLGVITGGFAVVIIGLLLIGGLPCQQVLAVCQLRQELLQLLPDKTHRFRAR